MHGVCWAQFNYLFLIATPEAAVEYKGLNWAELCACPVTISKLVSHNFWNRGSYKKKSLSTQIKKQARIASEGHKNQFYKSNLPHISSLSTTTLLNLKHLFSKKIMLK